ncbi:MAG: hypothetical protein RM347_026080 [Nostoc sp. ChiQUE02]|uniref:hypothetical protein n=1 Tax=Nostoc sp. ChiQUE02 TaxID=3075377 RepID=UPI002AD23730|nr:hypothetical protein [Nostoc sp. ChiQUE02]MDZ8230243.1 hypothetical protein [Nostoc sp. ChiQUE02]
MQTQELPNVDYKQAQNQFLLLWNQEQFDKNPPELIGKNKHRIQPKDLKIKQENIFCAALGKKFNQKTLEEKKHEWEVNDSSTYPQIGENISHLFLYGHSTWRTIQNNQNQTVRGISCVQHFISGDELGKFIVKMLGGTEGIQNRKTFLVIWLLTCYGASEDMKTDNKEINNDTDTISDKSPQSDTETSPILAQALLNSFPPAMGRTVVAYDKPVTTKTLSACRTFAATYKTGMDAISKLVEHKEMLQTEVNLKIFSPGELGKTLD